MKLTNISCDQFAGIRDRDIDFEEGINVVYGKNESGKSTIANLISSVLFQDSKMDGRIDKEFKNKYFPADLKDNDFSTDTIDGSIKFEIDNMEYKLSKEWGVDARCKLSTPNGIIKTNKKIADTLKDVLPYGEGVYRDMLLSSQYNMDQVLETLMDPKIKSEAEKDILNAVSKAFVESDDITIDKIELKIDKKIKELGENWDLENNRPVPKQNKNCERRTINIGSILQAYYDFEDREKERDDINKLEIDFDEAKLNYKKVLEEFNKSKEEYNAFIESAANLITLQSLKKEKTQLLENINIYKKAEEVWPSEIKKYEQAKKLEEELNNREVLNLYSRINDLDAKIAEYAKILGDKVAPKKDEIANVKAAFTNITRLENKLCGMNLSATIEMLNGHNIEVKSERTGNSIQIDDENMQINEAVVIKIPGIMEMKLAPADVNVNQIKEEIFEYKKTKDTIFNKFVVNSVDDLEKLKDEIEDVQKSLEDARNKKENELVNTSYKDSQDILKIVDEIDKASVREDELIRTDIETICGKNNIKTYIDLKENDIKNYEKIYGDIEALRNKHLETKKIIQDIEKKMDEINIPEEYKTVNDPNKYKNDLQVKMDKAETLKDNCFESKNKIEVKIQSIEENFSVDPIEAVEAAQNKLEKQKELLHHWNHIKEVFVRVKESVNDNPMEDIAHSFTKYLEIISDGGIISEFPKLDKLEVNIYSKNYDVKYSMLSEGTKETVSLAFRLAVLDHLFPTGGGIIVLDDPFTDMDLDRVEKSCKLVKECAKKHQVILLTCREEYIDMLGGNLIRF